MRPRARAPAGVAGALQADASGVQVEERRWIPAYVALGSNLDDPEAQLTRAFDALAGMRDSRLVVRSSLYRSPPHGPVVQPDFVNAVAGMLTMLGPGVFLGELKSLEERLGRARPIERWGPRRIDLDLLVHGATRVDEPGLTVPHPRIAERAFVLVPLAEIAPQLMVPGGGRVQALAARVDEAGVVRIAA
jgi:2-amino-4-hydroxy-6-hydroxymethyldihydropteridine diphosphokinase